MRPALLRHTFPVVAAALVAAAPAARADEEAWAFLDNRVPIQNARWWLPSHARALTDFRVADRYDGLAAAFFRLGAIWDVHPLLWVALQGTALGTATAPRTLTPEYRVELEPNLRLRFGPVMVLDRSRLERRYRKPREWWVYRNQLRIDVEIVPNAPRPFIADEVFIDLDREDFDQNRVQAGVAVPLAGGSRIDFSYILRSRETSLGWQHDHVIGIGIVLMHAWSTPHG